MGKTLQEMIQTIKDVASGTHVIKPWSGMTIIWHVNEAGIYSCIDASGKIYTTCEADRAEFFQKMGGQNLIFQLDPASKPIGTNPEDGFTRVIEQPISIGQRIKKILHLDQPKQPKLLPAPIPQRDPEVELAAMMGFGTMVGDDPMRNERMYSKEQYNIYIR
jgi:hypothetical protein